MWVFLNDAMISIVADRDDSEKLLVRARVKGDIERAFAGTRGPRIRARKTPQADYLFRATVTRSRLAAAMLRAVDRIDYDNFKASVQAQDRHDAYLDVWGAMLRLQHRHENPSRYNFDPPPGFFDHDPPLSAVDVSLLDLEME
ncbi:MAG TPA: hypothetical protein VD838_05845 [Anaeromyxobacteraceae bacterium]|nr:hypothetical protein [Anaeromyxobacteraceae bacterium]